MHCNLITAEVHDISRHLVVTSLVSVTTSNVCMHMLCCAVLSVKREIMRKKTIETTREFHFSQSRCARKWQFRSVSHRLNFPVSIYGYQHHLPHRLIEPNEGANKNYSKRLWAIHVNLWSHHQRLHATIGKNTDDTIFRKSKRSAIVVESGVAATRPHKCSSCSFLVIY